jgi:hypothetical protein
MKTRHTPGALIAIGGHEEKIGDRAILQEIASGSAPVIATLASKSSSGDGSLYREYVKIFRSLGVRHSRSSPSAIGAKLSDPRRRDSSRAHTACSSPVAIAAHHQPDRRHPGEPSRHAVE